jgi:hypothetical protein
MKERSRGGKREVVGAVRHGNERDFEREETFVITLPKPVKEQLVCHHEAKVRHTYAQMG